MKENITENEILLKIFEEIISNENNTSQFYDSIVISGKINLNDIYHIDDLLVKYGKHEEANFILKAAIAKFPESIGPLRRLVRRQVKASEYESSYKALQSFCVCYPDNNDAKALLDWVAERDAAATREKLVLNMSTALELGNAPAAIDAALRLIELLNKTCDIPFSWHNALKIMDASGVVLRANIYIKIDDILSLDKNEKESISILKFSFEKFPESLGIARRLSRYIIKKNDIDILDIALMKKISSLHSSIDSHVDILEKKILKNKVNIYISESEDGFLTNSIDGAVMKFRSAIDFCRENSKLTSKAEEKLQNDYTNDFRKFFTKENRENIILICDSLGLPRAEEGMDFHNSYPAQLQATLRARPEAYNLIPYVQAGRTITQARQFLVDLNKAEFFDARWLVMHVGIVDCAPRVFRIDDLLHVGHVAGAEGKERLIGIASKYRRYLERPAEQSAYTPLRTFGDEIRKINNFVKHNTGITNILFINIVEPYECFLKSNGENLIDSVRKYNTEIEKAKDEIGFHLLNINEIIWSQTSPQDFLSNDGYHLSSKGARLVADAIAAAIT